MVLKPIIVITQTIKTIKIYCYYQWLVLVWSLTEHRTLLWKPARKEHYGYN